MIVRFIVDAMQWIYDNSGFLWLVAALLCFGALAKMTTGPAPVPRACDSYANTARSDVPARCFSDFLGKDGGQ